MLEFCGTRKTPSMPALAGPLWSEVVAPDRVLFIGQIELLDIQTVYLLLRDIVLIRVIDFLSEVNFTPNQAETLLHSLERAAAGIGYHLNAHKTEYMCNNQRGDISTKDGTSLKLVDKFTYLGSSVSTTEKDIDTRLTNAWTVINRLSIIWKPDLTDKMKRSFIQGSGRIDTIIWMNYLDAN